MEFQAVILAGGRGSRMYPLTENIPKALLPVANKPLIWYPVKYLETAGFPEAIVIVSKANAQTIGSVLEEFRVMHDVKMTFVLVETAGDEWGTADALRAVKSKIKSDLLLLSCDLVTNIPLHLLADVYRTYNSTAAILLTPEPDIQEQDASKKSKPCHVDGDIIGLNETSQLLFFCSEADLADNLTLSRGMLKKNPHIQFHTDLIDGHLYLVKKWVLDYVFQNKNISSIKEELIPQLVKGQFQSAHMIPKPHPYTELMDSSFLTTPAMPPEKQSSHPVVNMTELAADSHDMLDQLALQMSSGNLNGAEDHVISCHAHIASSDSLCIRVNTIDSYKQVNKSLSMPCYASTLYPPTDTTLPQPQQQQQPARGRGTVSSDSLVGQFVSTKDKVSIKHSVVHSHSMIGEKSRLLLCVVMDHVKIGDNCNIQNTIICSEAYIEDNVTLKDCIVGFHCTVPRGTDAKGETFVRESEEMNL